MVLSPPSCLLDACPLVRVAAVGGISRLLNLFWELIPASTTAWLVTKLTGGGRGRGGGRLQSGGK